MSCCIVTMQYEGGHRGDSSQWPSCFLSVLCCAFALWLHIGWRLLVSPCIYVNCLRRFVLALFLLLSLALPLPLSPFALPPSCSLSLSHIMHAPYAADARKFLSSTSSSLPCIGIAVSYVVFGFVTNTVPRGECCVTACGALCVAVLVLVQVVVPQLLCSMNRH